MTDRPDAFDPTLPWSVSMERLLARLPGVVTAQIEGTREWVSDVRVWYEPDRSPDQIMAAVDDCLIRAGARLAATQFHGVQAHPDRRSVRRPEPEPPRVATPAPAPEPRPSAGSPPPPEPQRIVAPPPRRAPYAPLKLVSHRIEEVDRGIVGVQVWIEWQGRTFAGAAVGPTVSPGSLRTPALAMLRALHTCLQVMYEGPMQPGLMLESAFRIMVEDSAVVVVALTASENARPRALTGAAVDEGNSVLAVINATITATSRTVTRWVKRAAPAEGGAAAAAAADAAELRFTLVDVAVDRRETGEVDVGVRLAGLGGKVDRRRNAGASEAAQLELGAAVTLEAVHDLLTLGGWKRELGGELRSVGAYRLRAGDQDIVVVLAEAMVNGQRVRLAGASSADAGLERAAINAALQATNPLVADTGPAAGS